MRCCLVNFPLSCVAFLAVLLGLSQAAAAQSDTKVASATSSADQPAQASPSDLKLHVDTTLVLVPVTVTDSSNRYVLGLDKQDFHIFEDQTEQKIAQFSGEDVPLSIGLIVDTSGSIGDKLDKSRQALIEFLKTMDSRDEAFLIQFSDRPELVIGFTNNANEIKSKAAGLQTSGRTALLDAIYMGLQQMKKAKNPRKALLIISDGGDNFSRYTPKEIENLVREADVQIFAIGVFEPYLYLGITPEEIGGPQLLSEISDQTGGQIFAASDESQLPAAAQKIGIELRNQYVLAYSPKNPERDGKYRRIEVKLSQPQGLPSLKARWRLGYYAPTQ